jgi:hypothetical protein
MLFAVLRYPCVSVSLRPRVSVSRRLRISLPPCLRFIDLSPVVVYNELKFTP